MTQNIFICISINDISTNILHYLMMVPREVKNLPVYFSINFLNVDD
uniref:Uncharacterized protein n=1 Tax=Lepeophtheirus salmonis TaxID=72036 RepID=A0A0K2V4Z1_LEPSM